MTTPVIRTAYDGSRVDRGVDTGTESKVDQSFKDECDINRIMKRYERNPDGLVPQLEGAVYADVSGVPDFLQAQLIVKRGEAAFAAQPSAVRDHFKNDPAAFLAACSDPAQADKLRELGCLNPVTPPPPKPVPMEVVVVSGNFPTTPNTSESP